MKNLIAVLALLLLATSVFAQESDKLAALEKRVQQLEERIAELEASLAPVMEKTKKEEIADRQRRKAKERMRKDSTVYSNEELREIESLYQVANKKWNSQEGKDSLKQLIEKYDNANRTGCALLYLGQMSRGKEKEDYLRKAVDGFSDCYYGDGVQVGAYARMYLANYYKQNEQKEKAKELFQEIIEKYPDAIDHKGRPLANFIED